MGTFTGMRAGRSTPKGAPRGQTAPDAELAVGTNQAVGTANQAGAIGTRRRLAGVGLAAAMLPLLTAALTAWRQHLNLADDLLIYLVAVETIQVHARYGPALLAAVAGSRPRAASRAACRRPRASTSAAT